MKFLMLDSRLHNVIAVKLIQDYRVWIDFDDGTGGEVDFSEWDPFPGVFAPLREPEIFSTLQSHPEYKTLIWQTPEPMDVDPLWLYCRANRLPLPGLE
jgi:hypothetical protein